MKLPETPHHWPKLGLGLAQLTNQKKMARPARGPKAGQENIETVHEPKPIQTARSPWGQGRRAMRGPHGPRTLVHEGARAIKVSMSCEGVQEKLLYDTEGARIRPV